MRAAPAPSVGARSLTRLAAGSSRRQAPRALAVAGGATVRGYRAVSGGAERDPASAGFIPDTPRNRGVWHPRLRDSTARCALAGDGRIAFGRGCASRLLDAATTLAWT
jgi:hypothetical protein